MYKIHVSCLPANVRSRELKQAFEHLGEIEDVKLRRGDRRSTPTSAVLICKDQMTYLRILSIQTVSFRGRTIFCEPVLSGEQLALKNRDIAMKRVFISNLPVYMTDRDINYLFAQFGPVQCAYRIRGSDDLKKPFGYVSFFDSTSAEVAVHQRKVTFENKTIYVSSFKKNKQTGQDSHPASGSLNSRIDTGPRSPQTLHKSSGRGSSLLQDNQKDRNKKAVVHESRMKELRLCPWVDSNFMHEGTDAFLTKPNSTSYHSVRKSMLKAWHSIDNLRINTVLISWTDPSVPKKVLSIQADGRLKRDRLEAASPSNLCCSKSRPNGQIS
jgi:hypothetical protein